MTDGHHGDLMSVPICRLRERPGKPIEGCGFRGTNISVPGSGGGATETDKEPRAIFGAIMKKIGITSSGNVIVEMTPREWITANKELSSVHNVASLVKDYRQQKNVTQKTLARELGISRNTVSAVEQGKPVNPYTIDKILSLIAGGSTPGARKSKGGGKRPEKEGRR